MADLANAKRIAWFSPAGGLIRLAYRSRPGISFADEDSGADYSEDELRYQTVRVLEEFPEPTGYYVTAASALPIVGVMVKMTGVAEFREGVPYLRRQADGSIRILDEGYKGHTEVDWDDLAPYFDGNGQRVFVASDGTRHSADTLAFVEHEEGGT